MKGTEKQEKLLKKNNTSAAARRLGDVVAADLRMVQSPARIYRDFMVGETPVDFLIIHEGALTAEMVFADSGDLGECLSRIPVYDDISEHAVVVAGPADRRQITYFPADWGVAAAHRTMADLARSPEYRELESKNVLGLLTLAELKDFEASTAPKDSPVATLANKRALIKTLADRLTPRSVIHSAEAYLIRRGTRLDTVNPPGSVPEAAPSDFSAGVTEDPDAMELLGFGPGSLPGPQGRRLNRAARRRAAREAKTAKAKEPRRQTKEEGPSPAAQFLQRAIAKGPDDALRVTDEMIQAVLVRDADYASTLQAYADRLNAFFASNPIPEPEPVVPVPGVPEVYTKAREAFARLYPGLATYWNTRLTDPWEQHAVYNLLQQTQKYLDEPDPVIGPDSAPHDVPFDEIEARPGAPWMAAELINQFVDYLTYGGGAPWYAQPSQVVYTPSTGSWTIRDKYARFLSSQSVERLENEFGLPDYNALKVFEAMLNLQQPKFQSEDKTTAVMERMDLLLEEFQRWLGRDPWRRWKVEDDYNAFFSRFKPKKYDGSRLSFPGLSKDVELYPYQKDAVAQILSEKSTLLAFDVGAGKTYIMAAAAMNLRARKRGIKNLFVVPNNIVGQWERIFHEMYPDARLKIVEPKTFEPARRQEVLADIRDNDYDGVIMAYSSFELIPLSAKEIERQRVVNTAPIKGDLKGFSRYDTAAAKTRSAEKAAEKEADEVMKSIGTTDRRTVTLDQLGITTLYLDEAHNFKNVPIRSSLKNVAGINLRGSKKNLNLLYKVRAVQNNKKHGGVVFATGTPLSNSLADCYTMQRYLQPGLLRETRLDVFDNWVKTFARPEYVVEIDVDTSKFRYVHRLARFDNLPELSKMFATNAAFYAMEEDNLPELRGYTNVLIPEDPALKSYMENLCERTEAIRSGKVAPFVDNMLKVSVDGRLAALDLRLVGGVQPYKETAKVYRCVQEALKVYRENKDFTQIIFCDYSTPKANKFNVYDDLKRHLVEAGVPESEIAFVHSATTEAKKAKLYSDMNSGKVRILIGSTFKLGIGANVQTKLKAVHHLDVPWRPADMVQREGRILRRGNMNDTVRIFRYISEGSFDAYSWQILEAKQKFISQFLSGSAYERSATDLEDTVLTYAQVKALAINEPLMKVVAEKQNQLRRLRLLSENYAQTQDARRGGMDTLRSQERSLREHAERTRENATYLEQFDAKKYKELYKEISAFYTPEAVSGEQPFPEEGREVLGFTVGLPPAEERVPTKPVLIVARNGADYRVPMGDKASGNARRLINFFKKFSDRAQTVERSADGALSRIEGNENALLEENPYPQQIKELAAEIRDLERQIIERQQQRISDAKEPALV